MTHFQHFSDDELAALMKEGEEGAFDEIYNRHWDKLFYAAHRMVKSAEVAEEITQDTFMLFWMKRETLEIQSLKPYLAAMLRYEVYRYLAKSKQEQELELTIKQQAVTSVSMDQEIENKLLLEIITNLTNRLPEKCRLVFQYNKLQDRSLPDICEELNISPKTAEAHLTKALKMVRSNLSSVAHLLLQILLLAKF
ncbi:sigma-70 family RNA polymerase sigma factor [Dyadobacter chenwenxiniae]|uniref:Sigma-70 family RNA polymerase sigma factor n=1 Tax=Dyadobacter chenwenxiniae TaxID=2906456 RepID=A0A9X1PNF3_9BACT|nr:sigma-70 family RNA polymerase sigma factor [Dyadobacter chenwenxiniae]MCF0064006.1 sigma-70 family RNA polymerase sigma factor [Dyadobacter chenwenxiniae]UON82733.1 sigma-70 family RNA polymerase sigma factor [Dyadobacter chenwenxiniae]